MISYRVQVTTTVNQYVVRELGGKLASYEETVMPLPEKKADRIAALYRPDGATVAVDVEEKLNGPAGSYSSVTVRISLSARCAQTEGDVRKMTKALYDEGITALQHYVPPSLELLCLHVSSNG